MAALLRDGDSSPWSLIKSSTSFVVRQPPFGPAVVDLVRKEIKEIIRADIKLAAKFLRMAFHDSVGGADGCVSFGAHVLLRVAALVPNVFLLWSD